METKLQVITPLVAIIDRFQKLHFIVKIVQIKNLFKTNQDLQMQKKQTTLGPWSWQAINLQFLCINETSPTK